jgi:hypothetical protein
LLPLAERAGFGFERVEACVAYAAVNGLTITGGRLAACDQTFVLGRADTMRLFRAFTSGLLALGGRTLLGLRALALQLLMTLLESGISLLGLVLSCASEP